MQSWSKILKSPEPQDHVVQLYGSDEQLLTRNVATYARAGLDAGEGVLIVATATHSDAILRQLREDGRGGPSDLVSGQLLFLDAGTTLESFMVDRVPDWDRFQTLVGGALAQVRRHSKDGRVRAFGEMVGLLWKRQDHSTAIRLEQYWNRLIEREDIALFCAYAIDMFGDEGDSPDLNRLMAAHRHICAGPRTLYSNAV